MGSPEFAVSSLEMINEAGYEIVGVVTQPPRKAGRKMKVQPTPVHAATEKMSASIDAPNIPILTPDDVNDFVTYEAIQKMDPDIIVVVAYGQLLKKDLLSLPPCGCINAHASLLPRWRGASPLHQAILAGDKESGVSVMRMTKGMDKGPVLLSKRITLEDRETTGTLHEKLKAVSGKLVVTYLEMLSIGDIPDPVPQNNEKATYAPLMMMADNIIFWDSPTVEIDRHIRAYSPWPGATTGIDTRGAVKIVEAEPIKGIPEKEPGTIVFTHREGIEVATRDGIMSILRLKPSGKKEMSAEAFIAGHKGLIGKKFEYPV
jgi:methionyl-tRNA formyltransferase